MEHLDFPRSNVPNLLLNVGLLSSRLHGGLQGRIAILYILNWGKLSIELYSKAKSWPVVPGRLWQYELSRLQEGLTTRALLWFRRPVLGVNRACLAGGPSDEEITIWPPNSNFSYTWMCLHIFPDIVYIPPWQQTSWVTSDRELYISELARKILIVLFYRL